MQVPGLINRRQCVAALYAYTGGDLLKYLENRDDLNATEVTYAYWHVWYVKEKQPAIELPEACAAFNIEFFMEHRYSDAEAHVMQAFAARSETPQFAVDPLIIDNEPDL